MIYHSSERAALYVWFHIADGLMDAFSTSLGDSRSSLWTTSLTSGSWATATASPGAASLPVSSGSLAIEVGSSATVAASSSTLVIVSSASLSVAIVSVSSTASSLVIALGLWSVASSVAGSSAFVSAAGASTSTEAWSEATSSASTSVASSASIAALVSPLSESLALVVLLDFALGDWWLVADVALVDVVALGESDLEHGHDSGELEVVKAFVEWLVLVDDGDVADLVDLVQSPHSVLDELGQVDSALHSVGHALDHDLVLRAFGAVEELPGALEVSTDTDATSHSDLVGWQRLVSLLYTSVCVRHFVVFENCVFKKIKNISRSGNSAYKKK